MSLTCPACEASNPRFLLKWRKVYTIYRCSECRLIFSTPLPSEEDLHTFYQGFLFNVPSAQQISRILTQRKQELGHWFGKEKGRGKTFLDYGAGNGIATQAARELGYDAYYLDIDEEVIRFLTTHFSFDERRVKRDLQELGDQQFDRIFSDNVIEHEPDPMQSIQQLYVRLNPGGVLVIKTPLAANSSTYFYPLVNLKEYLTRAIQYNGLAGGLKGYLRRWWHCDPPRHIYSFSKGSFEALMKRMEIHEYTIRYYPTPLWANTLTKYFFSAPKSNKGIKAVLVRVLAFPFMVLEWGLKLLQVVLLAVGLITPGGITLVVRKGEKIQ